MLGRVGLDLVGLWITMLGGVSAQESYDLILRGGKIVDGCGTPWHFGDGETRSGVSTSGKHCPEV